ncbi:MAG TPA: hypothetical protein VLK29_08105, partial [Luteimonas sp.]|nr:hypothetical protein [Luteimonas sp.]
MILRMDPSPRTRPFVASCRLLAAAAWLALAGCGSVPRMTAPGDGMPVPTHGDALVDAGFVLSADRMDAWNAVGQLLVRTDGVQFEGRAEMLDLHAVRYRGAGLLVLTRAVPLSPDVPEPSVRVTARAQDAAPLDREAAHALLAHLQVALPAEIT